MTPEKARALREDATHGPWEVEEFEEQYAGCPPTTKFYLGSDDFQNIATAETTERHYDQTRANFALIAAAPELAEIVAGLRYEYAVQVKRDGDWVLEEDSYWRSYSVAAVRFGRIEEPARVVRRLASEPEVVQP